jgi:hypothetical protein
MSVGMVIFSIFIAVLIITVVWIIIYLIYNERRKSGFIVDETQIRAGIEYFWIWIVIEPINKLILIFIFQQKGTCLLPKSYCIL